MNQPDTAKSRYGQERVCPHCGARVAQRAHACFLCGASLEGDSRRRLRVPWADIALFAVIGGLVVIWWLRPSGSADRLGIGLAGTATPALTAKQAATLSASGDLVSVEATATLTPTATPTETPIPPSSTPEATPTAAPTDTPAPTSIIYTVSSGDNLQIIATRHGTSVQAIIAANNLSSDFIRIGQQLTIPTAGQPSQPGPTPTPTGGTLIYRVSQGDTIGGIAQRFNSSVAWILQANNLSENDVLQVGQSLLVPLSVDTPEPTATSTSTPEPATPTPGPKFRAPVPVGPVNGSVLAANDDVLLSWTSVGLLGEDEWYVVTLTAADGLVVVAPYWTKSTSWRLPPEYRVASQAGMQAASAAVGTGGPAPTEFSWQIQVVSGQPGKPGPVLSASSEAYEFNWQ